MSYLNEENTKAMDTILDCFGGADGGITFIRLRDFIKRMENEDSESARKILLVLHRFSKLIEVVQTSDIKF